MDFWSYLGQLAVSMADGLPYTVGIFLVTIVCALPLGLLCSFGRTGKNPVVRGFLGGYVWLFRGTPLLLQLFFFYFGITFLPGIGPYLRMERVPAAMITFVLNYTAYFCEIFRGGLKGIDPGQYEAAQVLGLKRRHVVGKIVVPQMLRVCLPAVGNETITLVKDTALVTGIGVTELLYFAKTAVNRDVNALAYAVVAVFYLIMTYGVTKIFKILEKKYTF